MLSRWAVLSLLFAAAAGSLPLAAQPQVTSANPNSAGQGTINLNVAVGGSGFKKGASSKFFLTGTTDPGGITVNSTVFVNSNQVTANITVASTATIASFDIQVQNADGRTGKGTGLFNVTNPNSGTCVLQPLPSAFAQVNTLNYVNSSGVNQYPGTVGISVRTHLVTLGGKPVLVTAAGAATTKSLEIFVVDPDTGAVLDGTAIGANSRVQPHITKSVPIAPAQLVFGDFNGDGVPDIATSFAYGNGLAYFFLGTVDSNGVLSYSDASPISPPTNMGDFGTRIASADLNGDGRDELVVGASAVHSTYPDQVFLFKFNGTSFSVYQTINDPAPKNAGRSGFGLTVALADVTGSSDLDLIVGAGASTYVYIGPGFTSFMVFPFTGAGDIAGAKITGGSYDDLIAAGNPAVILSGPVFAGETPAFSVTPFAGIGSWEHDLVLGDVNGDGLADIVVGAPTNSGCPGGAVYVFLSNPLSPNQPTGYLLEPPRAGWAYGESVAVSPAPYRLIFVGENGMGQVWVYKVN
jgi:FG-GAP repeat protein